MIRRILILAFLSFHYNAFNGFSQSTMPLERPDIDNFSPQDRALLCSLIVDWVSEDNFHIILHHEEIFQNCHGQQCEDEICFFSFHRIHIQELEEYLVDHNAMQFVPFPKWIPDKCVPDEFLGSQSAAVYPNLDWSSLDPVCPTSLDVDRWDRIFNDQNDLSGFCKGYNNVIFCRPFFDFYRGLESDHDDLHVELGPPFQTGAVNGGIALFWLWHAWVDDVYEQYLCICNQENHDYFGPNEEWDDFDRSVSNISGNENIYTAFRSLTTDGGVNVPTNRNIIFYAGAEVELNPGFITDDDTDFTAFVEACPRDGDQTPLRPGTDLPEVTTQLESYKTFFYDPYPNPFSNSITFRYTLGSKENVALSIYNLFGKLESQLVRPVNQDAGSYTVNLSSTNLAPGIYVCWFYAGNYSATKQIILIR